MRGGVAAVGKGIRADRPEAIPTGPSDRLYSVAMSRARGTHRQLLPWIACAALCLGCQSVPGTDVSISSQSSLLAVDVLFPVPLSRDLSLVQVFFMKGPIPNGLNELPELIPASFVKWSRAYLLNPEPGSYFVVAVTAEYAPPWNDRPIAGVSQTVWSGTSSDAMILPAELIHQTRTMVAPGEVAFMGALRVRRGDHINAHAVPGDDLQRRIAELVRPGVTSESGLRGWLKRTRTVEREKTSLSNEQADREAFFDAAPADLGDSPWAGVIARAAGAGAALASRPRTPEPKSKSPAKSALMNNADSAVQGPSAIPEAVAARAFSDPQAARVAAKATAAEATLTMARPEPPPPTPKPQGFPGVPRDSLLAKIELGMRHDEVSRLLGNPDGRIDRRTAKAWIPFYDEPGANLRDWLYAGEGRVVFSLYKGSLEVIDVVYDPDQRK